ncbi:MAG: radical SAM protein [Chlorobi bacterium]|nr:radical SAM protein [Chlorobiota bacterium]
MCSLQSKNYNPLIDDSNPNDFDFNTLETFLRKNHEYISLIRIHGGEPLIYKNIIPLIDLLNELKIAFNIITNGSYLSEEISKKLIDSYCIGVGISLDASKQSIYKKIRKNGNFETISKNIDIFNKLKKEKKSYRPVLTASMCVLSINATDMTDLVRFCRKHSIRALSVFEAVDLNTGLIHENEFISKNKELAHQEIKRASSEAKKLGVIFRTRFPSLKENKFADIQYHAGNIKPKNCINYYLVAWILPNLNMIGCSVVKAPFGNLAKNDFEEIWNSKDFGYYLARKDFKNGITPKVCEDCVYTGSFYS